MYVVKLGDLYLKSLSADFHGNIMEMVFTDDLTDARRCQTSSGLEKLLIYGLKIYKIEEIEVGRDE